MDGVITEGNVEYLGINARFYEPEDSSHITTKFLGLGLFDWREHP